MALPSDAAVAQPRAWGYDGRFDDLLFRLAAAPQRPAEIVGQEPDAPRVQTETLPEEFVSEFGMSYGRGDFKGGEGLFYAHRRDGGDMDLFRYWDSYDLDVVSSGKGIAYVTGQYDNAIVDSSPSSTAAYPSMVKLDDESVLRSEFQSTTNQILRIADPLDTAATGNETAGTDIVGDIVRLGDMIYCDAGTVGVYKRTAAGGVQTWATTGDAATCDRLFAAKGRLLAAVDSAATLSSVNLSTGAFTTVLTCGGQQYDAPQTSSFNDVVDAGSVVLAASWDGYVYALQDQSGTLTLIGQTLIGNNEFPMRLGYHPSGVVLVATREPTGGSAWDYNVRVYSATVNDTTGVLENVQLIREFLPESTSGAMIGRMATYSGNIYFLVDALASPASSLRNTDIWRYDVSTGGLFRYFTASNGASAVGDVVFIGTEPLAALAVWTMRRDLTTFNAGRLILPLIDHYTRSPKQWLDITLDSDVPDKGGIIKVHASDDPDALNDESHGSWVLAGTWNETTGVAPTRTLSLASRWLALKIEIQSDATTGLSPRLYSFTVRASVEEEDFIIDLPINVSDRIEAPGRAPVLSPGWGRDIADALLRLRGKQVELELYEPPLTATGYVRAVSEPITQIPRLGAATEVLTVRFEGKIDTLSVDERIGTTVVVWPWAVPTPVVATP